jgi:hypothetical protein
MRVCLLILSHQVPTGNKLLANAARTSSPAGEAFWRAALPGAPMPEAIRELLHPHAAGRWYYIYHGPISKTNNNKNRSIRTLPIDVLAHKPS